MEIRKYQTLFVAAVENDVQSVYEAVKDNFQTGWKKITGAPQRGNYNPNYFDVQIFCELILTHDLTHLPVPVFPFAKRLDTIFDGEMGWWRAYNVCVAWGLAIKWGFKCPQKTGALRHLLDAGCLDEIENELLYSVLNDYYQDYPHLHPDNACVGAENG